MTKRVLRRRKRRAEAEAFARDARFWIGKPKSADRSLHHTQPVNRQAARELKRGR